MLHDSYAAKPAFSIIGEDRSAIPHQPDLILADFAELAEALT
jgi:hypothetical protein